VELRSLSQNMPFLFLLQHRCNILLYTVICEFICTAIQGSDLQWKQTESGPKLYIWVGNVWGKHAEVGKLGLFRDQWLFGEVGERHDMHIGWERNVRWEYLTWKSQFNSEENGNRMKVMNKEWHTQNWGMNLATFGPITGCVRERGRMQGTFVKLLKHI